MIEGVSRERLKEVIAHLEAKPDSEWCTDVVRQGERNCCFGHLFDMGKDIKEQNRLWDWFEDCVATTYMIYPVNDGKHPGYPQDTPKARVLAYLYDILSGKQRTSYEAMEDNARFSEEQSRAAREAHGAEDAGE